MMDYEDILNIAPYSLNEKEKNRLLTEKLKELTKYHMENCQVYGRILNRLGYTVDKVDGMESYYDLPFMPVGMFKEQELKSISEDEIFKTMTSSGTTGQAVSKIYLDRETASNQQKTLVKIVGDYTENSRLPMLILDCPSVVKDRKKFSARGAGILGFSIFASDRKYAFDDDMNIDFEGIEKFMNKHQDKNILMFGFTFMIWQYFYKALKKSEKKLDISKGIMIHGGGWKKLKDEAVSPPEFNRCMKDVCGVEKVYDYYGMVEQTGCIYMECECGHLHASIFSDVITRRTKDFSVSDYGEKGIIQVVSILPKSYPGHNILTEDEGIILGNDDCPCGRKGKYFKIIGRLKDAEIRGCSDTFEKK